jgi:hypothetical protein
MTKDRLQRAVELHDYLYGITVGSTVNYGAFHGFFRAAPDVTLGINKLSSKLVGALRARADDAAIQSLTDELEGQLMLAQSVMELAVPDVEKALRMLDLVKEGE